MSRISTWGKFVGVLTIIGGAFSAIVGLAFFLVGAIPGIIAVYSGYLLYQTGVNATNYVDGGSEFLIEDLLENFGKYLWIQGMLMIINMVIILFGILTLGAGTRMFFQMF